MEGNFILEKSWISNGLQCAAVVTSLGHRCGYVGVPKAHPFYHLSYHDFYESGVSISVHGGLTYSDNNTPSDKGICYPMATDEPLWFFGFDCAHSGDSPDPQYTPARMRADDYAYRMGGHVWTLEEVIVECDHMAYQLTNVGMANFSHAFQFRHFRCFLGWKEGGSGHITLALKPKDIWVRDGDPIEYVVGASYCSPKDTFSRKNGRERAMHRALRYENDSEFTFTIKKYPDPDVDFDRQLLSRLRRAMKDSAIRWFKRIDTIH